MTSVSALKDQQAIDAANFVVQEWIKETGLEAIALWQAIDEARKTQAPIEKAIGDPKLSDPAVVAELSREMLQVFLDSPPGDARYRQWAQQGIQKATEARGQMFEPVSALITGTLLIGLVLAARIKRAKKGDVEFYPGLPNLSKFVATASSMFSAIH
jgi:hypothetical protein